MTTEIISKFGLEVTAQLAGLRAELGKIPGLTGEMATAMASQLNKSINAAGAANVKAAKAAQAVIAANAQGAIKSTEAVAAKASSSVETVAAAAAAATRRSAGQTLQASRMVTSNLVNIGNAAIATHGNLIAMSSAVPDVIMGLSQMGVSVSSLILGLGVIGGILAATYGAWRLYSSGIEGAREKQNEFNALNETTVSRMEAVRDRLVRARVALGYVTEDQVEFAKAADAAKEAMDAETKEIVARAAAIEAHPSPTVTEKVELGVLMEKIAARKQLYDQEVKAIRLEQLAEQQKKDEAAAEEAAEKAIRRSNEALRERQRLLEAAQRAGEALSDVNDRMGKSAPIVEYMDARKQLDGWADAIRAGNLEGRYAIEIQQRETSVVNRLVEGLEALADAEDTAAQASIRAHRDQVGSAMTQRETAAQALAKRRAELLTGESGEIARLSQQRDESVREYLDLVAKATTTAEGYAAVAADGIARIDEKYRKDRRALLASELKERVTAAAEEATIIGGIIQRGLAATQSLTESIMRLREKQTMDYADRLIAFEVAITAATEGQERKRLEIRRDALQAEQDERRKATMNAFRASKALGIVQAAIAGALAVIQSLAQYGVTPVGIAAAAVGAAAGVASAVAIAAEPPPSFHFGGMVGERASGVGDEATVRVTRKEGIVTPTGLSALGGADALRALNAGAASPAPTQYVTVVDGRIYEIQTARSLRRKSGPLAALLSRAVGAPGSFNPYLASR